MDEEELLERHEKRKKAVIRYSVSLLAGLVVTAALIIFYRYYYVSNSIDISWYQILSDSFFISGALIFCIGLLLFAADRGLFDMLAYGFVKFIDLFKKDIKKSKYRDFYDYKESKKERKIEFVYLLIIGAIWLAIATVFLILCENL